MREGLAVGASAVVAQGDAGRRRDAKCDQLFGGHFGMREGQAVGGNVVKEIQGTGVIRKMISFSAAI